MQDGRLASEGEVQTRKHAGRDAERPAIASLSRTGD
jgi:hypothetical protein